MSTVRSLLRFFIIDAVNLGVKGKLFAVLASFLAILLTAGVTSLLVLHSSVPIIVASMGASAVILFILPSSPLAQPWALVGGQLVSAIVGVACAQTISNVPLAVACAAAGSILAMLVLRCLHPPGTATALIPVLADDTLHDLSYRFVFMPIAINVALMLIAAIAINRWLLNQEYPTAFAKKSMVNSASVSEQDVQHALANMDTFIDVSQSDLHKLLANAKVQSYKRKTGDITCADIMQRNVPTVEYGTEVEAAWQLMYGEKLKAMPVIDRANRVIGIITLADFFKFINLSTYQTFQEKFRAFVQRTPDVSTSKPEAVGHIMSTTVTVLPETTHIADLISLMSTQGYRQIPIVNAENRLVGMVYQANLIAALYNEQLLAMV